MIPAGSKRIKTHAVPELVADPAEYRVILDDMFRHGGKLIPEPNWLMTVDVSAPAESYDPAKAAEFALSDEAFAKVSSYMNLMSAWVGGSQPPSPEEIEKYSQFIPHFDPLGLWESASASSLGRQDLGSIMDLNLLYSFRHTETGPVTRILEVGGGYGRLAEAAYNIFGDSIQYVMIDSVPASLYYAKKYLDRACPYAKVWSYYESMHPLDMSRCNIIIIPSWHFERINTMMYDVCINIESMQEMNQFHVDHYLSLFDRIAFNDGTIYLSNAHEYYFRGDFNYPANWQKLFCSNTPRSNLCHDHPTEIFRKTRGDYSAPNRALDAAHKYLSVR